MDLAAKRALVVGGSRGLGLGLAQALAEAGAEVTSLARRAVAPAPIRALAGDATDRETAGRVLGEVAPDLLVLNAGSPPPMGRIDRMAWEEFSVNWNADTRIALHWVQAALTLPMRGLVVLVSSGAAIAGSPLSGGYAGAKRAQWFIADYAGRLAEQQGLELRFRLLVPRQMVAGTGTGDAGIGAYAAAAGVSFAEQAAKWPVMAPLTYGRMVTAAIAATGLAEAQGFAVTGETGVTPLPTHVLP